MDARQRLKRSPQANVDSCDVLIVGGGPAGSACAWKLRQAGCDVVIADRASFPRDKVCAGWITPPVLAAVQIDQDEYRRGRTFQPITGFKVGLMGRDTTVATTYEGPVSFGIRRCEFDDYLLRRSAARLRLGTPVSSVRRDGRHWIVNESLRASMLIGAGGHFCPIARMLNGAAGERPLVAAQEVELAIDRRALPDRSVAADTPELYFWPDLAGYGWCFLKGDFLNVGLGLLSRRALPAARAEFIDFLTATRRISSTASWRWRGHAYLLAGAPRRRVVDAAVMLIGDAAGLAYPQSGEGIRPAIESGLLAAAAVIDAKGNYSRECLEPYATELEARFGVPAAARVLSRVVPDGVATAVAKRLLGTPWFVRHVVMDRWFLHRSGSALGV